MFLGHLVVSVCVSLPVAIDLIVHMIWGCMLQLGSGPAWTVYLLVVATVSGVSRLISHGLQHQSASDIACTIA